MTALRPRLGDAPERAGVQARYLPHLPHRPGDRLAGDPGQRAARCIVAQSDPSHPCSSARKGSGEPGRFRRGGVRDKRASLIDTAPARREPVQGSIVQPVAVPTAIHRNLSGFSSGQRLHDRLQLSPSRSLPSSQSSTNRRTTPSPHRAQRHFGAQASVATALPSSHSSPVSTTPLPQVAGGAIEPDRSMPRFRTKSPIPSASAVPANPAPPAPAPQRRSPPSGPQDAWRHGVRSCADAVGSREARATFGA